MGRTSACQGVGHPPVNDMVQSALFRQHGRLGFVLALWALLALARLSWLVAPPDPRPASSADQFITFAQMVIPSGAAYLYVQPGTFGEDTDVEPRLRYDLYPRVFDDVRLDQGQDAVRALAASESARYIVVPNAADYPADSWLRQDEPWFTRVSLDPARYVLVLTS